MIHLTPFAVSGFLTAIGSFAFSLLILSKGKTKLIVIYAIYIFMVGFWGVGAFITGANTNFSLALLFWKFAYTPVLFIPPLMLTVAFLLSDKHSKPALYFAYFQSMVFTLLMWTDKLITSIKWMFNSIYYFQGGIVYFLSFIFFYLVVSMAHAILIRHYQISYPQQKNGIFFITAAAAIGCLGGLTNFLPGFGINIYPYGNFLIPVSIIITTYALFRHHLFGITVVIQKSIVYTILITVISLVYLLLVVLLEKIFQGFIGYKSLVVTTSIAFVIGIIFIPLRNQIQYFIDRLFFKGTTAEIAQQNELLLKEVAKTERMRAVSILASGMAHEIKNPLTAIKTFSEFLPQKLDDKEFLQRFSKLVGHEAERINTLVHELLDFSKPSPPKPAPADIYALINNTLDFLSSEFLKKNIKIIKNFNADLRESNADNRKSEICDHPRAICDDLRLNIDPNQFKQVFLNLFQNAIEAMKGGGMLTVAVNLRESVSKSAIICVKDTGCGIDNEDLKHLFEPFFSRKDKGTGLGLAISRRIIEEHRGKIKVESEVGKGTVFTIELPLS